MPYLRSETARRLSDHGFRQSRIGEHLGVSQAMVSKYLHAGMRPPAGLSAPQLQALVDRSVEHVLEEESKGRLPPWCPLCPQWNTGPEGEQPAFADECLRTDAPPARDAAAAVLENLKDAADRMKDHPFARLTPQVNINLAMATPQAGDPRGVAAFPGRLANVRGSVRPVAEPQFGASNHLSVLLLRLRRNLPRVAAIACLRDGQDVRTAAKVARLRLHVLKRTRGQLVMQLPKNAALDAVVDPGDFGVEPILYLLGETAVDVVAKAERLLGNLPAATQTR